MSQLVAVNAKCDVRQQSPLRRKMMPPSVSVGLLRHNHVSANATLQRPIAYRLNVAISTHVRLLTVGRGGPPARKDAPLK